MDRDVLQGWLEDGLSLEEIGRRLGKHPSSVRYWVGKHGLDGFVSTQYLATGGIARDQLEQLIVEGLSVREIGERLGVSYTTVRYWLRRYELRTGHGAQIAETRAGRETGRRHLERTCPTHGLTEFVLDGRGYYRCTRCRVERVATRRQRVKATLVAEAGGRCHLCGHDECPQALHFHHRDPATKSFGMSVGGLTRSLAALRAEAEKCVLLCANCHAAVEAGVRQLG
jgi:transposase